MPLHVRFGAPPRRAVEARRRIIIIVFQNPESSIVLLKQKKHGGYDDETKNQPQNWNGSAEFEISSGMARDQDGDENYRITD
jgi:hypothetical protein